MTGAAKLDLLRSNHYFVVLEEEFDAIPLISYLAMNNSKTACIIPSPESLGSYKKIVSRYTSLTVLLMIPLLILSQFQSVSGVNVLHPKSGKKDVKISHAQLAAASTPSMLLQCFRLLDLACSKESKVELLVYWGLSSDIPACAFAISQPTREELMWPAKIFNIWARPVVP
jgi:hypothetical protein